MPVAEVIEIEDTAQGIRLTAAWAAVEVGLALDPGVIEAQVQGAMVYGLSAAMTGRITFDAGRVVQTSFPDFDPLRLSQCPPIGVTILSQGGPIRGIGEPGLPRPRPRWPTRSSR